MISRRAHLETFGRKPALEQLRTADALVGIRFPNGNRRSRQLCGVEHNLIVLRALCLVWSSPT
jgi:hypothetical protein